MSTSSTECKRCRLLRHVHYYIIPVNSIRDTKWNTKIMARRNFIKFFRSCKLFLRFSVILYYSLTQVGLFCRRIICSELCRCRQAFAATAVAATTLPENRENISLPNYLDSRFRPTLKTNCDVTSTAYNISRINTNLLPWFESSLNYMPNLSGWNNEVTKGMDNNKQITRIKDWLWMELCYILLLLCWLNSL